jgi:geranylgeranyl pyrophosphate synthase/predicted secreted hydrolase
MNFYSPRYDESPHADVGLEWWFVQGEFTAASGRRPFMICFFRHGLPTEAGDPKDGSMILSSILDPISGKQRTSSRIDRYLFDAALARNIGQSRLPVDQAHLRILLDELRLNGPFVNIDLVSEAARIDAAPLRIVWQDFSLIQGPARWDLRFREPGTDRLCAFELVPIAEEFSHFMEEPAQRMAFRTYPRLALSGRVGEEEVSGTAWLDHQWGDYTFLTAGKDVDRVLGWDWFGINFDDGEDWMAFLLKDASKGEVLYRRLLARDPAGRIQSFSEFDLETLGTWESPATNISYPVECRLHVPALGAAVEFKPLARDQEIPVFGLMRAVWDGAGEVTGRIGTRDVRGRARAEFHGYGYIFDIKEFLKTAAARVDRQLADVLPKTFEDTSLRSFLGPATWTYLPSAYDEMLSRPIWDLLSRGGKRWRPLFAIFLLDALGTSPRPYERLICALGELCHVGALIIDDIEDRSLLRRGEDAIHIRYGLETAISAANTMYFLPVLLMKDHPGLSEGQKLEIYEIYIRQLVRAHFGQALDLYWSKNMSVENLRTWVTGDLGGKILQMYAMKTAALIESMAEVAAIVAELRPEGRTACMEFATALGVGFQILDDIHNYSSSSEWKKVRGEDIAEGKLTYVLCRALESLGAEHRTRLMDIVGSENRRKDPEEIGRAIALVQTSGAIPACRQEAEDLIARKWDGVRGFLPPSEPKIMFQLLYRTLMDLRFE